MGKPHFLGLLLISALFIFLAHFDGGLAMAAHATGTQDGSELWGYVQVRPRAHMFWWYYKSPFRTQNPNKPWPIILWLQGGPGASGVGIGNFEEIGPLDTSLNPRNSTWLRKADLLFVDTPVGTGYSFVEDKELLVKTDDEAAMDLTKLLMAIFNRNKTLQKSPLYIVAESYGGKYAVTLGLSALKAIKAGKLKLILGGVALGDSWISPYDFVASWGPLLKDFSRIDNSGLKKSYRLIHLICVISDKPISENSLVEEIKQQIADGQMLEATKTWSHLERAIIYTSNNVDFYNFLLDAGSIHEPVIAVEKSRKISNKRYSRYLQSLRVSTGAKVDDIHTLMNGVIKKKLGIIPKHLEWKDESDLVFEYSEVDFMRPRIEEVDMLLEAGVNVTIYNGQLDLICSTKGAEAWVEKLKWEGLKTFLSMDRTPLYCGNDIRTKGFTKSYKNLQFFWILDAGHFVPVDQPCVSLDMVGNITRSPMTS
ncbi:hypothetical protein OSB04_027019 [Centaurea solstitialis]|uniref:Carboxypeptidase n=1 Tax=Centaurea solstitialis TaxID=347529 RepID=A0AA38SKF5_9ASTR|nr:hypothetical protein OSB04_027019 [Centaurea solstitialis]